MSKTQIPTGGIADDAISEEHLDATALTGHTALAAAPASTDEFLISDGGVLKRIDASYVGETNTPYFLARLDGNQDVSDATQTVLVFDEEALDSGSGYDTSNGKYTIPSGEGGKYYFEVRGEGDGGGAGGLIQVAVYIFDGSSEVARGTVNLDSTRGDIMSASASTLIDVSAGDEITCKGFVDNVSGSNTRFAGESGINRTYFLGYKVSAS